MTENDFDKAIADILAKREANAEDHNLAALGACHLMDDNGNVIRCKDDITEGECGVLGELYGTVRWIKDGKC